MSVDLPGTFRNPHITLPIQLDIQSLVFLILIGHNGLFVGALKSIAIWVVPGTGLVGLVVGELALVVSAVGEHPSALGYGVVFPFADEFHSRLAVGVSAFALLLAKHPPATISVLIRIDICALAMLHAIFPLSYTITQNLTIVLAFILIRQLAYPVLVVVLEVAFVPVPVCVNILPFTLPDTVNVVAVVLVAIGVLRVTLACVVA